MSVSLQGQADSAALAFTPEQARRKREDRRQLRKKYKEKRDEEPVRNLTGQIWSDKHQRWMGELRPIQTI